ncbi:MAG: hypothetical protein ACFCUG_01995 [Thiotrichales bacterium]
MAINANKTRPERPDANRRKDPNDQDDYAPTTVMDLYVGQDRQIALAAVAAHLRASESKDGHDYDQDSVTLETPVAFTHTGDGETLDTDNDSDLDPTIIEEASVMTELAFNKQAFLRYQEVKAHIKSFEKFIGKDYEVGINFKHYFEYAQSRLRVVAVYASGSVSFLGQNDEGQMVNYFDHIDDVCFTLVQLPRRESELPRRDVVFCFTSDGKLEHLE